MRLWEYLRVLDVRRRIIIQITVAVAVLATAVSLLQTPSYEAQSVLLVKERNTANNVFGSMLPGLSFQPERSIQTHLRLIQMPAIADGAARRLQGTANGYVVAGARTGQADTAASDRAVASQSSVKPFSLRATAEDVVSRMRTDVDPQSNLIYVTIADSNPLVAAAMANAVAAEYSSSNRMLNTAEIEAARREVSYKLQDTEEDVYALGKLLTRKGKKSGGKLSKPARRNAAAKLKMSMGVYQMLAGKEEELKISQAMEPGEAVIIQRASVPRVPAGPKPLRDAMAGLLLGAVLGIAAAVVIERVDNTIKNADDVARAFHLPLLAQIPVNEPPAEGEQPRDSRTPPIVLTPTARSASAEAYRTLRTSLAYLNYDAAIRTILVTSACPGEGKTSIVGNLAMALAHAGHRVLVVDCDLRKPALHRSLGVPNQKGLSNVLAGQIPIEKAVQSTHQTGLSVITSGPVPPNPSELLNSARMDAAIENCRRVADFVIFDSPPALAVTDCAVMAPKVDGVLLAAAVGETARDEARRLSQVLSGEHVRLLGVVLDKVPAGKHYGYYYYYSYHPEEAA